MRAWMLHFWERLRTSLWVIPAMMALGSVVLAYLSTDLDRVFGGWEWAHRFLYAGTPAGTRTLLSTVAGSMITVAGVSFSVTMVALSLASTQLGPRLLVNFMRDKGNQLVLGSFIATFMYSLLSLGAVADHEGHSVSVSASFALLLAVFSLLLLIYFIHHIASSMQSDVIIQSVAEDIEKCLHSLFTAAENQPTSNATPAQHPPITELSGPTYGYLQGIDENELIRLAKQDDIRIEVLRRPGHYVTPGLPLVRIVGLDSVSTAAESRIVGSFIIGGRRTPEQDPEYGIFQLVEIALRALSPGINDPFTAMTCIDHLSGLLASVAGSPERPPMRMDADGSPRLMLDEISFEGIVEAAFNQVRQSSVGNAAPSIRILEALNRIAGVTSDPARLDALAKQADQLYDSNLRCLSATDTQALESRYRNFGDTVSRRRSIAPAGSN